MKVNNKNGDGVLETGVSVPTIMLTDQDGQNHTLEDYQGKKVLLYFYPKDMTPGCTVEAKGFRDTFEELKKEGVVVLGISPDTEESHKKFCEKHELPFTLLADTDKTIAKVYGVWVEKSMFGNKYMGVQRDSFLIDEDGDLLKHFVKVSPAKHPQEVLDFVQGLKR